MVDYAEDELLKTLWGQRQLGLVLPFSAAWNPDVMQSSLEYIRNHRYPFLQIVNDAAVITSVPAVKFLSTDNGWIIFDYEDAMSSAAPHRVDIGIESHDEAVDGNEAVADKLDSPEGIGTTIMQQANTAFAMIVLAKEKGWSAVRLSDGTKEMQRYAWIAAQFNGVDLRNYTASEADYKSLERIRAVVERSPKKPIVVHEEVLDARHKHK